MPVPPTEADALPERRRRRLWWSLRLGLSALALLLVALMAALWAIDTGPGHRLIADRIAALAPSSGLRIRVGRIEGSVWNAMRLRDVRLYDVNGLFLEAPELALDWRPAGWIGNRLHIDRLDSDLVRLSRLPRLKPSGAKDQPILPGFDIHVGRLAIKRLALGKAITGEARVATIVGRADIRDGRALIDLKARSSGGDRLALLLDAEPDRDRFDLDARLAAPADGVVVGLVGGAKPIALSVAGDGRWTRWDGAARLDIGRDRIADLRLGVRGGSYSLSGMLAPAPITKGKLQRLSTPRILITGEARLADRRLDTTLSLRSAALAINAAGVLDLAASRFDPLTVNAHLLRPQALFPNMTGSGVKLRATFEGPFAEASYDYALSAPGIAFDRTGFEDVRVAGRGLLSPAPVKLPLRLSARRVTGVGDVAGGILGNLNVEGMIAITANEARGERLALKSDKLNGKLSLLLDLRTGRYGISVSGQLTRYLIPGLGIVDVTTELSVSPGAGGRGTLVEGTGRAWVRRLDNGFFRSLAGGLPEITTRLRRDTDGVLRFSGLVLSAPSIRLAGNGMRRRDGTFQFEGAGSQAQYGPVTLALDGNIARPKLDILLPRPMDSLGLSDVRLNLDPAAGGFAYRAAGGSTLGPFTSNGAILTPPGAAATIAVAALNVSGARASGALRSDPGGFAGQLVLDGSGGLSGQLLFMPVGSMQRIAATLAAERATLALATPVTLRRATLDGALLIDPAGLTIDGSIDARGFQRGGLRLARLSTQAALRGGSGTVTAAIAGPRRRGYDLKATAELTPNRATLTGGGLFEGRRISLTTPAVLTREGDGWRLAATRLAFNGGGARLAGRYGGGGAISVEAGLDKMPLSVLDIAWPRLGLGGYATGTFSYSIPAAGAAPAGRADLKVRGLTRSGLVLSSQPVDLGVTAMLRGDAAVARAVVASKGQTIGRAQARLAPLPAAGTMPERLANAPLFAQLRYNGPADTLWRLTGIETIDLSGPLAVGADVTGRLSDPLIRGSLRTTGARIESAVSGTVIDRIAARGRFGGSRLVIDEFTGATRGGGSISGRGAFDFAAARGFGMDLRAEAKQALLLNRDDIAATVTGPISITSDGAAGVIAGDVRLDSSRFRLGQAAAAAIPRLNIRELNRPADDEEEETRPMPWRLDLKADAPNRLTVTGLGLDSEWRAMLSIGGTVDNPAITGRADLVRGGYEFAGRRFDLERGSIRFTGEAPPDPVLDIVARASIQGLNATIQVSGTGLKPDINFASVPALPEDELLSRLLFGTSITNLSAPEALQLAAAVASLQGGGTGLNPINAVRQAAGLDRLRILPADVTTGQGTSVAAGKYITRRTYVEVITDGQGYSATRVEFQITRWLSLLSSVSTIGRQSANVRVSKDY